MSSDAPATTIPNTLCYKYMVSKTIPKSIPPSAVSWMLEYDSCTLDKPSNVNELMLLVKKLVRCVIDKHEYKFDGPEDEDCDVDLMLAISWDRLYLTLNIHADHVKKALCEGNSGYNEFIRFFCFYICILNRLATEYEKSSKIIKQKMIDNGEAKDYVQAEAYYFEIDSTEMDIWVKFNLNNIAFRKMWAEEDKLNVRVNKSKSLEDMFSDCSKYVDKIILIFQSLIEAYSEAKR